MGYKDNTSRIWAHWHTVPGRPTHLLRPLLPESRWELLYGRVIRCWPSQRPGSANHSQKSQDRNLMRVAALVRVSAAIAAFPPAHARAVRNERARASLQAFACTSARVRSLASGRCARALHPPAPHQLRQGRE
jgi:hypothetical protein